MTNNEFSAWLYEHKATFPGFSQWLKKLGVDPPDEPGTKATVAKWQVQFRQVTLDAAKKATRRMQDGVLKCDWPGDHLQTVFSDAQTSDREDREERKGIDCPKCRDSLFVPILEHSALTLTIRGKLRDAVQWWRKRRRTPGALPVVMVYCDCQRGTAASNHENNKDRWGILKHDDIIVEDWRTMSLDQFVAFCEKQSLACVGDFRVFSDGNREMEF